MKEFLEILKYVLPSGVVFATAYYLLKVFLDNDAKNKEATLVNENKKRLIDLKLKGKEMITPIRLQAYERIVLFLERITPGNLVMRIQRTGMSAYQLQKELNATIREEYEHNLSQQLYISSKAWELVKESKEQTIKLINSATVSLDKDATGTDLSQVIFELTAKENKLTTHNAIEFIKKEINDSF